MDDLGAIGEDKGQVDVGWRLLGHPRKRREDDRPRLTLDHLDDRGPLNTVFGYDPPERRRLHDAEPDVKSDGDHHDAEQERDAPAPDQKLVAGNAAEHEHCHVCQQQPGGSTELRPRGDEAAVLVGPCPLHRKQHRATPLISAPQTVVAQKEISRGHWLRPGGRPYLAFSQRRSSSMMLI